LAAAEAEAAVQLPDLAAAVAADGTRRSLAAAEAARRVMHPAQANRQGAAVEAARQHPR
jgi:hypothetical protein